MNKLTIGVIFGGRSGEHEVSLVSAASVINSMDKSKYKVVEIGIDTDGRWLMGENCLDSFRSGDTASLQVVSISTDPHSPGLIVGESDHVKIDIFFPVLHGPYGEDGTIQGLFEMMNTAYVGCGVLASSTAMDKIQCKAIWRAVGLPVVPAVGFTRRAWTTNSEFLLSDIEEKIAFPCFVKPANMGSSVGVTKAKDRAGLICAIDLAAKFDSKILVEKAINAREIECAVLGNDEPVACAVGEIIVGGEFYDFNDKYLDGKSSTSVPADLPNDWIEKIKGICLTAYKALDCSGLSRVDCFLDRDTNDIYLNEINTMPGFTSISMYPKMAEYYGLNYPELIDKLIELGLERFLDRQRNQIKFESGSEWFKG